MMPSILEGAIAMLKGGVKAVTVKSAMKKSGHR